MVSFIFYSIYLFVLIYDIYKNEECKKTKTSAKEISKKTMVDECPNCKCTSMLFNVSTTPVGALTFANQYMMSTSIQNCKVNTAICKSCGNNWNYYTEQDIVRSCNYKIKWFYIRMFFLYAPIAFITFMINK